MKKWIGMFVIQIIGLLTFEYFAISWNIPDWKKVLIWLISYTAGVFAEMWRSKNDN